MKKLLAFILALLILALAGCSKVDNTSSDVDTNSSEIVSSNDESSSTETSSNETSSETSSEESSSNNSVSLQTSIPSKTETTSTLTTSIDKTESKNETSSTTTTPTTYFEKHNLKLSTISNDVCFNDDPNHTCSSNKKFNLSVMDMPEMYKDFFCAELFGEQYDISKYKVIDCSYSVDCFDSNYSTPIFFDKYTGALLGYGKLGNSDWPYWQELNCNNKNIYISVNRAIFLGISAHQLYCPKNYDGAIVAIIKNKDIPYGKINDGETHTIDEIIDFENDKYYLFAAN